MVNRSSTLARLTFMAVFSGLVFTSNPFSKQPFLNHVEAQKKPVVRTTHASNHRILIEKINMGSGEILPGYERREICRVYSEYVDIERMFGMHDGSQLRTSARIDSTVTSNVDWVITMAEKEPLNEKPNDLCDAPETVIRAFEPGSHEEVVLFRSGGCGSPRVSREGAASEALRDLVGSHCPTTYDFDGN